MKIFIRLVYATIVLSCIQFIDSWIIPEYKYQWRCISREIVSGHRRVSTDSNIEGTIKIETLSGDEKSIFDSASFLINSFWLGSSRQQTDTSISISDSVKASLIDEQAIDLMGKYGERLGKPLLRNCLLAAKGEDNNAIVGFVCLHELLLDKSKPKILTAELSENILKNSISSLGPKQRRQYQKSSAMQLSSALLPENQESIVCFSNLSIIQSMRRKGIAVKLCNELENVSKDWGYNSIFLQVESDNTYAKNLYEKIGYVEEFPSEDQTAIRLDTAAGEFIEIVTPTTIMKKNLV